MHIHGGVAQLGERTVRIRKVESSILFVSTRKSALRMQCAFLCNPSLWNCFAEFFDGFHFTLRSNRSLVFLTKKPAST